MRFTSWCQQRGFETFDPTLWAPGAQTAYAKGRRGRLPSPARLRNQGLVQKGQPEAWGVPKHTVTLSPRLMLDALVSILFTRKVHE